jgi:hypothetical protein
MAFRAPCPVFLKCASARLDRPPGRDRREPVGMGQPFDLGGLPHGVSAAVGQPPLEFACAEVAVALFDPPAVE